MSETKKEIKPSNNNYIPLLEYLQENKNKLEILLSGDQGIKPLMYPIKGKRTTKTIFLSQNLQTVMAEYCTEYNIKMGDFAEVAIIQYLVQNGYEDKIKPLLNATVVSLPTKDESKEIDVL